MTCPSQWDLGKSLLDISRASVGFLDKKAGTVFFPSPFLDYRYHVRFISSFPNKWVDWATLSLHSHLAIICRNHEQVLPFETQAMGALGGHSCSGPCLWFYVSSSFLDKQLRSCRCSQEQTEATTQRIRVSGELCPLSPSQQGESYSTQSALHGEES